MHALVPGGAFADQGTRGVPTPAHVLCPGQAVGSVCRAKVLAALRHSREPLVFAGHTALLDTAQGLQRCLDQRYDTAWVVSATRPLAGPHQVLDSLGRDTHRVAIANHRLVEVHETQGRFPCRNRRQGHRRETMPLPAPACIRRVRLPVVPHGVQRLRHLGVLANRGQAQALQQCRPLLHHPASPKPQKKTVAAWRWQWTGTDVTPWPHGGHGPLPRLPLAALPAGGGTPGWPPVWHAS